MAMENYSPSHPTDEVDLDNSPDDIKILSESIGKSKFSESIEQPQVFDIIDRSKFSENVGKSIEYELSKHPIKERSRSMSPDVRKVKSKSRSHSRSRKRRSKSRSRNRRSRSRNRTDRSRNRDREYNRRSTDRKSHSKDRRSRSKDRKPRSNERRSKSRDRRSRSRNSRYNSRSRDSPNQYRSKEKKNDNIFSKMNELSNKSSEPISKQKWNYDSDEDASPKKAETMNVLEPVDRFDDMKPLVNFNESSSRVDDMKPLPRRNEFFNRRGGNDQFRGFQRNRNWEPRNSGRSNFPPRNDQRFNRNKFGFNDDDTTKWQGNKNEDSSLQKMSWNDGKQDDDLGDWGKPVENNDSPIPDKKGFAADSDEECNNWGNDNKNAINEMLTAANIESQRKVIPIKNNVESLPESKNNFAADSDEEFGTWGNEQKVQTEQPQFRKESFNNRNESFNDRNESFNNRNESFNNRNESFNNRNDNKSGNDSDEEFGSWGKDRNKPRNFNQSNDNQGDSFNPASQQFFSHNQRQQFNRNDSNPRFQGRRAANNNFNRFQRPNNQDRFNNNNFNSSSGNFNNSNYNSNSNFSNFNPAPPNISQQSQQQQQTPEIMSQLPMQIPPYNFNPSQRPPQWPPMNNLNFPPMCNNQMPFNPLPMIPQMQYSQINQSQQQTSQQQQSSLSIPNMMQGMSYIPPPPPSSQPTGVNNSQINSNSFNQSILPQANDSNLLETIMTNVGLSSKSIRLQPDIFKPQPPQSNKNSVNDSLHNIIKSAASTVLSRLVESTQKSNSNIGAGNTAGNISDSMSMSPPSPSSSPPPPFTKSTFNLMSTLDNSEFILPPLPNYSDVLKPATCSSSSMANVSMPLPMSLSNTATSNQSFKQLSASSEISEEKRNRSDFESKSDWQERIALEVKNFLRPAYMSKKITKSDYKEIMKRCVTKISRSGVTEINTEKIEKFVLSYVDKYQKFRRGKQHGVVSSSEHELVM